MSIEVASHRNMVVLVLPANGDHKQRLIGYNVHEAHDLARRIIECIAQANGFEAAENGKVPEPKPIPQRSSPRKRTPRGK